MQAASTDLTALTRRHRPGLRTMLPIKESQNEQKSDSRGFRRPVSPHRPARVADRQSLQAPPGAIEALRRHFKRETDTGPNGFSK